MSPDERHNDMLRARDFLLEEHGLFKISYFPNEIFPLPEARFKSQSVRSYYAYLISKYIEENSGPAIQSKPELFQQVIPLVVEVVIAIQYYHNQVLDAKSGKAILAEALINIASADSLKHHLYQYPVLNSIVDIKNSTYLSIPLIYKGKGQDKLTGAIHLVYELTKDTPVPDSSRLSLVMDLSSLFMAHGSLAWQVIKKSQPFGTHR